MTIFVGIICGAFLGFIGGLAVMSILFLDDLTELEEIAKLAEEISDTMGDPVTAAEMNLQRLIQKRKKDRE